MVSMVCTLANYGQIIRISSVLSLTYIQQSTFGTTTSTKMATSSLRSGLVGFYKFTLQVLTNPILTEQSSHQVLTRMSTNTSSQSAWTQCSTGSATLSLNLTLFLMKRRQVRKRTLRATPSTSRNASSRIRSKTVHATLTGPPSVAGRLRIRTRRTTLLGNRRRIRS